MKVTFRGLTLEHVTKGRSRYTKGVIEYTYNGEARKQSIMSFSNPTVFKQVQELSPGDEIDVEITKNDAGYNEWKSVNTVGGAGTNTSNQSGPATASTSTATRVTGSNYETREERASRQVLIVKQSSLNAAVATLAPGAKAPLNPDEVIALADRYKDYVFAQDEEDVE